MLLYTVVGLFKKLREKAVVDYLKVDRDYRDTICSFSFSCNCISPGTLPKVMITVVF